MALKIGIQNRIGYDNIDSRGAIIPINGLLWMYQPLMYNGAYLTWLR